MYNCMRSACTTSSRTAMQNTCCPATSFLQPLSSPAGLLMVDLSAGPPNTSPSLVGVSTALQIKNGPAPAFHDLQPLSFPAGLLMVDPSAGPPNTSPTLVGEYTGTLHWYWSNREGSRRTDYIGKTNFGDYHCYVSVLDCSARELPIVRRTSCVW
jgi:hypothetical protein